MNGFARQTWLVMLNELADALRSRRALVILLLYVAAGVLTTNGSISVLLRIENELSEALQLGPSDRAGVVSSAIWKSDRFRRMVGDASGHSGLVDDLTGTPPIVLIYGGLAFFYTPLLVMLVAGGRVAEELASGSARYALLRTSRLSWSVGKFLGQVALVGMALLLSGVGAWITAEVRMAAAERAAILTGMLLAASRAWIYSIAFVGLASGLSHLTRSPGRATAVGLVGLMALGVLSWAADHFYGDGWRQLWHVARMICPPSHRLDLWRLDPAAWLPAVAYLVSIGLLYLFAGFARFRRMDL